MITLNTDNGLERIKDCDDFDGMAGFNPEIDPKGKEVKSILGTYEFKEKIKCGLSTCKQPHNKGYLVQFGDGQKTNIGNKCGRTMFGLTFISMQTKFDKDLRDKEARELLQNNKDKVNSWNAKLVSLLEGPQNAKWIHSKLSVLTSRSKTPMRIVSYLNRQKRNPDGVLYEDYEASEQEIELAQLQLGKPIRERPYYLQRKKGYIEHVSVLTAENDLKDLLISGVQDTLRKLESANPETMLGNKIRELNKAALKVDISLDRAEKVMHQSKLFLKPKNLKQLTYLCQDADERLTFQKFIEAIPSMPVSMQ